MKHYYITLLCLLFINTLFSQKNGLATYSVKFNTEENKNEVKGGIKLFDKLNEISKNIFFDLTFNKNESLFDLRNKLDLKNSRIKEMAITISGGKGKFYNNSTNRIREVNAFGELFLIDYILISESNWILKKGTRIINGFNCYKAELTADNDEKRGHITAWYSPEIPFQFGPKGIGNLPGLIVELIVYNKNEIIFSLTNLKFNNTKIKFLEPKNGRKITINDFNIIKKEMMLKILSKD
ncbi:MAG: GLPGLI family protein [Flavobacteriaceae bacterium]|nr:GLPGLI family protein [Flavobacteriaceae bacterium]